MTKPRFIAPVSATLSVVDVAKAAAFFVNTLGFERRVSSEGVGDRHAEVIEGPVTVRLVAGEGPRGAVFFEVDDLDQMRSYLEERGVSTSASVRVNRIKMEMFEVVGPNGHRLWFGTSFDLPTPDPASAPMFLRLLPCLPHSDVPAGVRYYQEVLGFAVDYAQDDIGVMYRDGVSLLLVARDQHQPGMGACYGYVRDADALYAALKARGASLGPEPVSQPWGLREFHLHDGEGNRLTFGQPFE